jgi:hypothetical protein
MVEPPSFSADRYKTIRAYAIALIRHVDHIDMDGRAVGLDYAHIRNLLVHAFPAVTHKGPYRGRRPKIRYRGLWDITIHLNQRGERLPLRPYRKRGKRKGITRSRP